jgi:hypothetical protein
MTAGGVQKGEGTSPLSGLAAKAYGRKGREQGGILCTLQGLMEQSY